MGKPLCVLLVEDSEDDALLVLRALKTAGYEPDHVRVETAEAMAAAIRERSWDVILCDYQLPRFNGLGAIEVLKKSGIDIPLLIVSGTIGEEIAVESMRAGAHDYIMKNTLARLVPAIERELKEAKSREKRRRAETDLHRSTALLESAGRMARFGGWSANLDEGRMFLSDQVADILEIKAGNSLRIEEALNFYAPEWRDAVYRVFRDCAEKGIPYDEEMEMITAGGKRIWVRTTGEALRDKSGSITLIQGAFQNITERKESVGKLQKALEATVQAMAVTVETRDPYTAGHQRRVADLARSIAAEIGLSDHRVEGLYMAAVIHDIGKISVPAEILSKPTKLTDIEFSLIKTHSQAGYDILKDIEFPWPIARIILEHHERMNGSGYPRGLTGSELLLESRILAVADVVESMASHRPYRPSLGTGAALEEITKNRGVLYDPQVVDVCLHLFWDKSYTLAT